MKLKSVKFNLEEKAFDVTISLLHDEVADILEAVNSMEDETTDGVKLGSIKT